MARQTNPGLAAAQATQGMISQLRSSALQKARSDLEQRRLKLEENMFELTRSEAKQRSLESEARIKALEIESGLATDKDKRQQWQDWANLYGTVIGATGQAVKDVSTTALNWAKFGTENAATRKIEQDRENSVKLTEQAVATSFQNRLSLATDDTKDMSAPSARIYWETMGKTSGFEEVGPRMAEVAPRTKSDIDNLVAEAIYGKASREPEFLSLLASGTTSRMVGASKGKISKRPITAQETAKINQENEERIKRGEAAIPMPSTVSGFVEDPITTRIDELFKRDIEKAAQGKKIRDNVSYTESLQNWINKQPETKAGFEKTTEVLESDVVQENTSPSQRNILIQQQRRKFSSFAPDTEVFPDVSEFQEGRQDEAPIQVKAWESGMDLLIRGSKQKGVLKNLRRNVGSSRTPRFEFRRWMSKLGKNLSEKERNDISKIAITSGILRESR